MVFRFLMKHKDVIPLTMVMTCALSGMLFASFNALKKSDVIFNRRTNPEPWQNVDPTKPQKLVTINQKWKAIEELEKVRKITKE